MKENYNQLCKVWHEMKLIQFKKNTFWPCSIYGFISCLIFRICQDVERDEFANETAANYVCLGLPGFGSVDRASPH